MAHMDLGPNKENQMVTVLRKPILALKNQHVFHHQHEVKNAWSEKLSNLYA